MLTDEGIIRHRGKIESTINNAQQALALIEEKGSLAAYFWSWEPAAAERPGTVTRETLLKMTTAYAMLANGGKQVHATFIDRIQDRWGRTVWRHDERPCDGCKAQAWNGQAEPDIIDDRKPMMDPHTAYQMTSILEGVVQRGTGTAISKKLPGVNHKM